ncbi:MAG TPA: hypothetical protein P5557_06690 [Candidatus Sumerlaeia bacterium]|nr:hypothetical protein [Candidatus Sumerlaeia bacterium]
MDEMDIKKRFALYFVVLLFIAWLFSVKSFSDNRAGVGYAQRLDALMDKINDANPGAGFPELVKERDQILKEMSDKYRFPKFFFFFFVILACIVSAAAVALITKLPLGSRIRNQSASAMIAGLIATVFILFFFFMMEYQKMSQFFWVFTFVLIQWLMIGISGALYFSDNVYEALMGLSGEKRLIQGAPPSAWDHEAIQDEPDEEAEDSDNNS